MARTAALILALSLAALPVRAEQLLSCADIDGSGFTWDKESKSLKRVGFIPMSFTVKVVSKTERLIDLPTWGRSNLYICQELPRGIIGCTWKDAPAVYPFLFNGDRYERVGNASQHVGGDPDLSVAYGRCLKF